MSWSKTTVEGQTMYERSDGVRVSRTQDIDAIERQEKVEMDYWRTNQSNRIYDYNDDVEEHGKDEANPVGLALVFIMVVALIVMFFTNN